MTRDYAAAGLKCGIEIHQQLDTSKLFCACESNLTEDKPVEIERILRPCQSELGEVDRASLAEARRNLRFIYQNTPHTCLVEIDEEPPHHPNSDAVIICLQIARLLEMSVVDEIHFMRKIVIDGSNTAGFQRTALFALDGRIATDKGDVRIASMCLEEDAARKVKAMPGYIVYRLDRLGIPLVEIATEPDMKTPGQVQEVAEMIGMLLRATKKVKRGLGTIRQDINVSIARGNRVEIKGAQDLGMIGKYVELEVGRQEMLADIVEELRSRGRSRDDIDGKLVDVTEAFRNSTSRVIKNGLEEGGVVIGTVLPGFKGLIKGGEISLGAELAGYAKLAGVKGIFHSDELPAYGITGEEMNRTSEILGTEEGDAWAIVCASKKKAENAMNAVVERARMAHDGVPEEVRGPRDDGTTEYQRPMPGAARMYPETDVPPLRITRDDLENLELPEIPTERIKRFTEEFGIHEEPARQLVRAGLDQDFEDMAKEFGMPAIVARTLLNTVPELESEGYEISDPGIIGEILRQLKEGKFAKEAVADILRYMLEEGKGIEDAKEALGLTGHATDIEEVVREIVEERIELVRERGEAAHGPIMGVVMKKLRGKVDGKVVAETLRKIIAELK
jgi:glutamyl-tRNA(Gln) amidotransferase subunit E